jgi:hypothetical protein
MSKFSGFVGKWLLRLSICAFLAFAISTLTGHSRPLSILFIISFLICCLVESMYIWLLVCIYAKLNFPPPFMGYSREEGNLIWPAGKEFEKARQVLARNEFKFATTLIAPIDDSIEMSIPIFYSSNGNVLLWLRFPFHPYLKRTIVDCMLISYLRNGTTLITHNLQAGFTSFYIPPFDPCQRQFATVQGLINKHNRRIKKSQKNALCLFGKGCLQMLNDEKSRLEEANIAYGYCERREDCAGVALSFFGKYRLWVKTLLSEYLGL